MSTQYKTSETSHTRLHVQTSSSNSGAEYPLNRSLFIALLILSLVTLVGPFTSFRYYGTQIIPHPSDAIKGVIKDNDYAIVFDGGSTGTRIHIFSFTSQVERRTLKVYLENEVFAHITPGLSSYANNHSLAADSLQPLLQKALKVVPDFKAFETSLILKATAGLRMIPEESANNILKSVQELLVSSPYKVNDNAVSILDDRDEGLYAWYTVNFLLGKLHNITKSIVTLDLGGGSTQITFATNNVETLVRSPNGYIVKRDIEGEPQYIYTHSYLGKGLKTSRKDILLFNNSYTTLIDDNTYEVTHPCFEYLANNSVVWKYQDLTFIIKGEQNVLNAFERCYEIAKNLVINTIHKPPEIQNRDVYALSYFYDRMKDVRVIKAKSGVIKVRDYYMTTENVCKAVVKMRNQNPFLCLDLTYITALIHDGLGLDWLKDITLVKKINGIETSWALGAAINLLHFDYNSNKT